MSELQTILGQPPGRMGSDRVAKARLQSPSLSLHHPQCRKSARGKVRLIEPFWCPDH